MAETVYLSLGSNLGNRLNNIACALAGLEAALVRVVRKSSLYETEPRDVLEQPWFLNLVIACETELNPQALLHSIQDVEYRCGRVRQGVMQRGPRTIDIDLLLFGDLILESAELTVPHPRWRERRFVLEPLLEIAPGLRDPKSGCLLAEDLARVSHQALRFLT